MRILHLWQWVVVNAFELPVGMTTAKPLHRIGNYILTNIYIFNSIYYLYSFPALSPGGGYIFHNSCICLDNHHLTSQVRMKKDNSIQSQRIRVHIKLNLKLLFRCSLIEYSIKAFSLHSTTGSHLGSWFSRFSPRRDYFRSCPRLNFFQSYFRHGSDAEALFWFGFRILQRAACVPQPPVRSHAFTPLVIMHSRTSTILCVWNFTMHRHTCCVHKMCT